MTAWEMVGDGAKVAFGGALLAAGALQSEAREMADDAARAVERGQERTLTLTKSFAEGLETMMQKTLSLPGRLLLGGDARAPLTALRVTCSDLELIKSRDRIPYATLPARPIAH